jgi:hypothetical protein
MMNQHLSVQSFHEVSVLFCATVVWLLMALFAWSVWLAVRDGVKRLRMLHQIPCSHCQYFTQQYCLKCTVHPVTAFSEDAIACPDYCAIAKPASYSKPHWKPEY